VADAKEQVLADLARTRSQRIRAFLAFAAAAAGVVGVLMLMPPTAGSDPRDPLLWPASMLLLLLAVLLAGSVTLGVPLWQARVAQAITLISSLAAIAGTLLIAGAHTAADLKIHCAGIATAIGLLVFVALRAATGLWWRRFPDSTWVSSVGATGIGLAFLGARCGRTDLTHLAVTHLPAIVVVFLLARGLLVWALAPSERRG
jgi:hypothetical protein